MGHAEIRLLLIYDYIPRQVYKRETIPRSLNATVWRDNFIKKKKNNFKI